MSATGRNTRLPTLSYHEGVPGHHLQISIAQESKDIPTLRKLGFFSAYSEGWALYAEQLADELGVYAATRSAAPASCSPSCSAPPGWWSTPASTPSAGAANRRPTIWSQTTGFARPRSQREVERYCTQIGQACSYKVGHTRLGSRPGRSAEDARRRSSTSSGSTRC